MGKLEEKGFEIATKDLMEELGDDFRKSLVELSFEKAEKGYKNMRDVQWHRVSMIRTA
ncbi:Uncharacterised protein [uncultured archaeon]|nr:Uncharacterised protein [uncultured archaeon]